MKERKDVKKKVKEITIEMVREVQFLVYRLYSIGGMVKAKIIVILRPASGSGTV